MMKIAQDGHQASVEGPQGHQQGKGDRILVDIVK
jgi:hypothetical protein